MDPAQVVAVGLICATVVVVAFLFRAPVIQTTRAKNARAESIDNVVQQLRAEFGKAIEAVMDVEETVKRHRARIDGATRGAPKAKAQQGEQLQLDDADVDLPIGADPLDAYRQRARARGLLR